MCGNSVFCVFLNLFTKHGASEYMTQTLSLCNICDVVLSGKVRF
jgi:hypothetical protein